jgi:hypothetical protein
MRLQREREREREKEGKNEELSRRGKKGTERVEREREGQGRLSMRANGARIAPI